MSNGKTKGIKTIKRKQCLGRSNIISLKEENGTHIRDRDRMIKRCEEFYTNLYSTKLPQGQPSVQIHHTRSTHPPPILPTEMSAAIKRLKRSKAPGNDNITADVLKDHGEPIVQMFTNMFNMPVPQRRQTPKQLERCFGDHYTQKG